MLRRTLVPLPAAPLLAFLFATLLASICRPLSADDWPQFRGPNCTGISQTTDSLPVEFSASQNVRWSCNIGDGVGSPTVVAGRVFVSGAIDEETIGLYAFDATTGQELWKRTWQTGQLADVHKTNSHSSTTAAADEDRVYFYFSTLGMLAVDAETGRDVWQQRLPTPFFVFKWGPAMSPTLYKDRVLFVQDDDLFPALYALDKTTGDVLWKDDRNDMAVNYSHPVICETDRGDEIVVGGTGLLVAYDPDSGDRIWTAKVLLRNIKTTPVVAGGTIYVSLQSGGIANQWLATADQSETGNNDGRLSKLEMQAFVGDKTKIPDAFYAKTFDRGDANNDGYLDGEELDTAFLSPDNFAGSRFDAEEAADEYVLAVQAGGQGDVTDSHLMWKHKTKHTDHIVSPLVRDGRMLLIKGGGISTVFNTTSGEPLRKAKRIPNACEYFASPIYGDGKIYVAGENGVVVVLENNENYDVLAKNDMGDSIVATPAIAGDSLFIRTRTKLFCIAAE